MRSPFALAVLGVLRLVLPGWKRLGRGALTLGALAVLLALLAQTAPPVARPLISPDAPQVPAQETLEARVLSVESSWETSSDVEREGRHPSGATGAPHNGSGGVRGVRQPGGATPTGSVFLLEITRGSQRGRIVRLELGAGEVISLAQAGRSYRPGDRLLVSYLPDRDPSAVREPGAGSLEGAFQILDKVRWPWLVWLGVLFAGVVVVVARGQGLRALIGLASAVGVLWWFLIPRLLAGQPPVPIALAGCALIAVPSLVLTHGWGRGGLVPLVGIAGSLAFVGALTGAVVPLADLTGLAASEEISLVYVGTDGAVDPQGLLLAGMLVGVVGALIDVTVAQAAAVFEFHAADRSASRQSLFARGMAVGRAHIAAAVHTLVLAYVGAALPLLLLLALYATQLDALWNREMIVVEVVRSAVGAIGLSLAMPLTTWLACLTCHDGTPLPAQSPPHRAAQRPVPSSTTQDLHHR